MKTKMLLTISILLNLGLIGLARHSMNQWNDLDRKSELYSVALNDHADDCFRSTITNDNVLADLQFESSDGSLPDIAVSVYDKCMEQFDVDDFAVSAEWTKVSRMFGSK